MLRSTALKAIKLSTRHEQLKATDRRKRLTTFYSLACLTRAIVQSDPPREVRQFTAGPSALKLIFKRREGAADEIDGSK